MLDEAGEKRHKCI